MGEPRMPTRIVGERLLALRKDRGMSQEDVCEAVEITASYLSRLEQGRYTTVTLDVAGRLADYYEVSLDFLTGRSDTGSVHPKCSGTESVRVWQPVLSVPSLILTKG
jgi:transcriptional regulator with XRE-family HTH domain